MMKVLLAAALVTCVAGYGDCQSEYKKFLTRFQKKHNSSERFQTFCSKLAHIKENNRVSKHTWAVNELSDLTKDEFRAMLGGRALNYSRPDVQASLWKPSANFIPTDSVDWRSSMPGIKNQGTCGSCWTFASIDVVDYFGGSHSEQQILDCDTDGNGCNGGNNYDALQYLQGAGSDTEDEYSYQGSQGSCQQGSMQPDVSVSDVHSVNGEDDLAAAVSSQVVAVSINAGDFDAFQNYDGTYVYNSDCGSDSHGHAIGVVGYTDDYWIIRNSWGESWGDNGYGYFQRGSNLCAIGTRDVAYASVSSKRASQSIVV